MKTQNKKDIIEKVNDWYDRLPLLWRDLAFLTVLTPMLILPTWLFKDNPKHMFLAQVLVIVKFYAFRLYPVIKKIIRKIIHNAKK